MATDGAQLPVMPRVRGPMRGRRTVRPSGPSVRASFVSAMYACPPLVGKHEGLLGANGLGNVQLSDGRQALFCAARSTSGGPATCSLCGMSLWLVPQHFLSSPAAHRCPAAA